jgi:hypothetical protein
LETPLRKHRSIIALMDIRDEIAIYARFRGFQRIGYIGTTISD